MKDYYILEKQIQIIINKEYKGELEKEIPIGRIDILSDDYLIEIKTADKWKDAIGQLFTYECYLDKPRQKLLVLFGYTSDLMVEEIKKVCNQLNIQLRLVSAEINLSYTSSLSEEFNYELSTKLPSKNKKQNRLNIYLENLLLSNLDIAKLILEIEPDTKLKTLEMWVGRQRYLT